MPSVKKPDEIRNLLEGPVNSIPTTFLPNGQLDWEGIGRIIDIGIASGSKVSLLTYGDSQFEFLSDEEVAQLTRFLVDRVAGRALTVAATRRWPDDRAVQFAEYCRSWGADVLMVLPPEQAQPQGKIIQYRKVAQVMPLMLVGCPPYEILDELLDAPNICTFKEDGTLEYAKATVHRYGDRWKFMTGGGLWRNFAQWPCGIRAFFCYPSSFAPHIAQSYWRAFQDWRRQNGPDHHYSNRRTLLGSGHRCGRRRPSCVAHCTGTQWHCLALVASAYGHGHGRGGGENRCRLGCHWADKSPLRRETLLPRISSRHKSTWGPRGGDST